VVKIKQNQGSIVTNITETDLIQLGFERQETWEFINDTDDLDYYFTKEFGEEYGLCLITNCKSESKDGWVVEFFDNSGTKPIKNLELLEEFINVMNKIQNAN
jgi:hypothetical protein